MTERHIARLTVAMTQLFQISPDQARVAIAFYKARSGLSYQRIYALLTTGQLRYRGGELHRPLTVKLQITVNFRDVVAALRRASEALEGMGPEVFAAAETFRERWASPPPLSERYDQVVGAMQHSLFGSLWPASPPPLPRCRCIIDDPLTPPPLVMPRFASCPGCEYFDPNPYMPCAVNPSGGGVSAALPR